MIPIEGWIPALVASAVFVGCGAIERQLLQRRAAAYFALGLPLPRVRPIPSIPDRRQGATEHTRWHRDDRRLLFFGAEGRRAVLGLHGRVDLVPGTTGVTLKARFLPPITPLVAVLWLLGLGAVRGELALIVPLSVLSVIALFWIHRRSAIEAVDEIRLALVQG